MYSLMSVDKCAHLCYQHPDHCDRKLPTLSAVIPHASLSLTSHPPNHGHLLSLPLSLHSLSCTLSCPLTSDLHSHICLPASSLAPLYSILHAPCSTQWLFKTLNLIMTLSCLTTVLWLPILPVKKFSKWLIWPARPHISTLDYFSFSLSFSPLSFCEV